MDMSYDLLKLWAILYPNAMMFVLILTWLTAYLSPSGTVEIGVNWHKEANVEAVVLLISTILSIIGTKRIIESMG